MNQSMDENRIGIHHYMMEIAGVTGKRSTCVRRSVGAVITDSKNHILSTGYNGVPRGAEHCTKIACSGVGHPSGTALDLCSAIHAEVNAICHCADLKSAHNIYVTTSPCMSCMKMIASTNIRQVFYKEKYSDEALQYFKKLGGETIQII